MGMCQECLYCERVTDDDTVSWARVWDPDTGRVEVGPGWMCEEHQEIYLRDGYAVQVMLSGVGWVPA